MSASAHREPSSSRTDSIDDAEWATAPRHVDHSPARGKPVARPLRPVVRGDGYAYAALDRRGSTDRRLSPHVEPLPEFTAAGAALAVGAVVTGVAVVDRLLSPGLGILFGFIFALTSVYAALRMSWRDAWAALALPPLVFVTAAGLSAQVTSTATGGWVARTSTEIADAVLGHPYFLLAGTLLAVVSIAYRFRVE